MVVSSRASSGPRNPVDDGSGLEPIGDVRDGPAEYEAGARRAGERVSPPSYREEHHDRGGQREQQPGGHRVAEAERDSRVV